MPARRTCMNSCWRAKPCFFSYRCDACHSMADRRTSKFDSATLTFIITLCIFFFKNQVPHIGTCSACQAYMQEHVLDIEAMFFLHVRRVLQHVRDTYPQLTCIMWDDMFRYASAQSITSRFFLLRCPSFQIFFYIANNHKLEI